MEDVKELKRQLLHPALVDDKVLLLMVKWSYMPWRKRRKDGRRFSTNNGDFTFATWRDYDDEASWKQCEFLLKLMRAKSYDFLDELKEIINADHPSLSGEITLSQATFGQMAWLLQVLKGILQPIDEDWCAEQIKQD